MNYEKRPADLKKGISSREPSPEHRLDEEDLIKMNLDDAICEPHEGEEMEDFDSLIFKAQKTD